MSRIWGVGVLVVLICCGGRAPQRVEGRSPLSPMEAVSPAVGLSPPAVPVSTAAGLRIAEPFSATSSLRFLLYLPTVFRLFQPIPSPAGPDEWTQHGHDAQRTSFTRQVVPPPWRWKWAWNGPDAQGRVSPGKFGLPRNSQPVTGGGRVYIAAGPRGVFALDTRNGAVLWNWRPDGAAVNSTPAYDPQTDALFALATNGVLYKLNAATGNPVARFATGASSDLPLPPALFGDRVFFSMGTRVYALNTFTMGLLWSYDAGSPVHTPPAYSPAWDRVVVASQDLYVHAIHNRDGSRAWRVKPTVRSPGDPGSSSNLAEVKNGWPVIAEGHGLVLIKLRLDWEALWKPWSPWPGDNTAMRQGLKENPSYQALMALRLADGSQAFVANVGHGGFGDGGYLPMGPQPVVRRFPDGSEVAYVVMRGSPCLVSACDGRWDSRLGEMVLDDTTVPGSRAGDVRFMQNTFFPTDEQVYLSMAGDFIFGAHWMFGLAHEITDRSPSRGSGSAPILTRNLPHIITSASNCGFSPTHYCPDRLVQDNDPRTIPGGFYIYYNQGNVYDQYWSEYAAWVISNQTIYFVSTDGAVVALEHGDPNTLSSMSSHVEVRASSLRSTPSGCVVAPFRAIGDESRPILYTAAREHVGRIRTVEGPLRFLFNNGKAVYLGFRNPHQGAFKIRIPRDAWARFGGAPEARFRLGQWIRVTGCMEWYQGDPAMTIRDPAQIQVDPTLDLSGWELWGLR